MVNFSFYDLNDPKRVDQQKKGTKNEFIKNIIDS